MPDPLEKRLKEADTYQITVRFTRSFSDDIGVVKPRPGESVKDALIRQFVTELQSAYDHPDVGIAGRFQVMSGPLPALHAE